MPKRASGAAGVVKCADVLDERAGFRLSAKWGHVGILQGGGHIAELVSRKHGNVNVLWHPPWKTLDPHRYEPAKHRRQYGGPPDGRLLAGIAGHSLSFDHFGPPSREETEAGLSTHGEASWRQWRLLGHKSGLMPSMRCGVTLSDAQFQLEREIALEPGQPIAYCEESAENLLPFDRPICWNEHVTFGPPFLEAGVTMFDMPATLGKVSPASYSSRMLLQPDAEFTWPLAPSAEGVSDLRKTSAAVHGRYTAQLLDHRIDIAWIAAGNPKLGLLVVYLFRRTDFPWVGNWEENRYREMPPWNGKTFCRGIEFSTTPFAVPRRESVTQGSLFGEPTYRWLSARAKQSIRYAILLFDIPNDFAGAEAISIDGGRVRVRERGDHARVVTMPVRNSLH